MSIIAALSHIDAAIAGVTQFNHFMEHAGSPAIKRGTLSDACRTYKAIRDAYEALDEHRKKLHATLEELNRDTIPSMMEEAGTPSLKVECGPNHFRFVRSQRMSASVLDKDGGYNWLREVGQGGIIQETVNAQTLGAFAKRWIQDEGKDLPAEFFKINTMNIVRVDKA